MVAVVQLVERLIVVQVVVGSSPIGHPIFKKALALNAKAFLFSTISYCHKRRSKVLNR